MENKKTKLEGFAVLDVETRHSAQEVGGWHKADLMGVSVLVIYDSRTDSFKSYTQERIPEMIEDLQGIALVVGFNIVHFDYKVLAPHAPDCDFKDWQTLDMLSAVHAQLSHRLSLDNLSAATLGTAKSADGMQALKWWKEKKLELIEEYCRQDVALTRDLYLFGKKNGYLLYTDRGGNTLKVTATWVSK